MKQFRISKVLRLYGMIWFYSVFIAVICIITGVIDIQTFNVYDLIGYVFPVSTEHYWFGTAYLILLVFMPLIHYGASKLDQKQFGGILAVLLLFYCIAPSILPVQIGFDHFGYDAMWFIIVYMLGGYLSLYGSNVNEGHNGIVGNSGIIVRLARSKSLCLTVYLACAAGSFAIMLFMRHLFLSTGSWKDMVERSYHYNFILPLLGSVALVLFFAQIKIPEGRAAKLIRTIAGCTFGVYLIHEHMALRYAWQPWFHTENFIGKISFLPHMIATVLIVFVICATIEYLRQRIVSAFCKWYTSVRKK